MNLIIPLHPPSNILDVVLNEDIDDQDTRPTIQCLRGILNDDEMVIYAHISYIDIHHATGINVGNIPAIIYHLDEIEPDLEPPPSASAFMIPDMTASECAYDALFPIGIPYNDDNQYSPLLDTPSTTSPLGYIHVPII